MRFLLAFGFPSCVSFVAGLFLPSGFSFVETDHRQAMRAPDDYEAFILTFRVATARSWLTARRSLLGRCMDAWGGRGRERAGCLSRME